MTDSTRPQTTESPMDVLRRNIGALANLPETEAPVISAFIDLRHPIESQRASFLNWCTIARHTLKRDARLKRLFDEVIMVSFAVCRYGFICLFFRHDDFIWFAAVQEQ